MSASEFALKHCGCTFRARETRERLSEQQREAGGEEGEEGGGRLCITHFYCCGSLMFSVGRGKRRKL